MDPRGAVVEPHQRRARKRRPEPCRQEPMSRSEAHRPHGHQLGVREVEAAGKTSPASGEHGDRLAPQPAQGELEHSGRGSVDPLCVVDGHEYRPGRSEHPEDTEHGEPDCARVQ